MRWEGKFTLALWWFINFHRSQKSSFAKSEKSVAMFCYDFRWGIYFSSILKIDSLGGVLVILGFGLLGLLSCILRWLWMGDGFAPDRKISGGNWVNFHSPLKKSGSIEPWQGGSKNWAQRWGEERNIASYLTGVPVELVCYRVLVSKALQSHYGWVYKRLCDDHVGVQINRVPSFWHL